MNYQTELMQKILTNKKAQELIDYVSQIYGSSYVGLWLFQAIGSVLGPVSDLSSQLRYETSPATTTLLLDYWEREYGIAGDPSTTIEQRRNRVIAAMTSKGACNPARLADSVSAALGGVPVEILEYDGTSMGQTEIDQIVIYGFRSGQDPDPETSVSTDEIDQTVTYGARTGQEPDPATSITTEEINRIVTYGVTLDPDTKLNKNKFIVNIRGVVSSYYPAIAVIERMKPAHLIYTIQGVAQEGAITDVNTGVAMTQAILYKVEVTQ